MLEVFLSLFKTVDPSARQQQDEIPAQAHRTCRDSRSLQFPAEIEAIVHKAAVIMH